MKRCAALLFAALLAAACVSAGPAPYGAGTPTPAPPATIPFPTPAPPTLAPGPTPTSRPSGSCIFWLDVDNQTDSPVSVVVNGVPLGGLGAGRTQRFYENMDGHPPLPWSVEITRTADDVTIASKDYPVGTESGSITVGDEPQAIAAGYCP